MGKAKRKKDADLLEGIDQISWFAERSPVTLLEWKRDYEFPMKKVDHIWISDRQSIKRWYADHDGNPKTISREKLIRRRTQRMRERGEIKLFNKTLKGLFEIAEFFSVTTSEVQGWQNYVDCPIEMKDGTMRADADRLQIWLEGQGIKLAPGISRGPKKGRDLFYEGFERF